MRRPVGQAVAMLCLTAAPLLVCALPRTLQPLGGPPFSGAAPDHDGAGPVHTQLAADKPASMPGRHLQEERSAARVTLPNLIIQYGESRTASTLQFQTLCAIALVLNEADPARVDCSFKGRDAVYTDEAANPNGLRVWKTHNVPSEGFPKDAWLFTSEIDDDVSFDDPWQDAAQRMSQKLDHEVKYVQVLSRLTGRGSGIATEYKPFFGLSDPQVEEVVTYLRYWDVLRMCCGAQMNDGYRAELISTLRPNSSETSQSEYPACDMYRIQAVESQAVETQVFKLARKGGFGTRYLRGTSSLESDEGYDLNGQYCAWFNRQVACQELPFNQLPENPGCDGEQLPRESKGVRESNDVREVRGSLLPESAAQGPPSDAQSAQAQEELDGYARDDGDTDGSLEQMRMHYIGGCQTCGVDWCAKVSKGGCVNFVLDDATHVLGAELSEAKCGDLTSMTPYCVAGSSDIYAVTKNKVPSSQQQQPATTFTRTVDFRNRASVYQMRMHHINGCQTCGVDWCAKASAGGCVNFVLDDATHVLGAELTEARCDNLTSLTPYCVAGSSDIYAVTKNKVPSSQQQQPATPSESAPPATQAPGKDENGICFKPSDWCVHGGSENTPSKCDTGRHRGITGHYCHDTAGESGFKPCNRNIPATWGYGVPCEGSAAQAAAQAANTDEHGMCQKPADWCVQVNSRNRATMCNGMRGHFCYDTTDGGGMTGLGFHSCAGEVPDSWGYDVQCLESACACSSTCDRDAHLRSSSGHCGQAVDEGDKCTHERLTAPSQPGAGIVVLERNEVYRVDDMIYCDATSIGCMRARLDARTILCEKMYRGTLLRKMLAQVTDSSWKDAKPDSSVDCDMGCEAHSSAIEEPLPGFAYASYRDAQTALQGVGDFLAAAGPAEPTQRLKVLSQLIEDAKGDCTPAAETELVVPLRMGDVLPSSPEDVVQSVKDALATPAMQRVTSVVFNAVMHYGANEMNDNFMRTPVTDQANMAFVDSLSLLCVGLGIPISFRSEPSVDTDLCYLVHSPRLMIAAKKPEDGHSTGGTFPLLVAELRASAKGAQRHTLLTKHWPTVSSRTWSAVLGLGRSERRSS